MIRALIASLFVTTAAVAVPAPISNEELARRADLVVEAEVKSVACVGAPADKGDFVSTEYESELEITRTLSGKAPAVLKLSGFAIQWKDDAPVGGVPPSSPLPKGWRGKLHLQELTGGGFAPVWHNAVQEDAASSRPEPLPKCTSGGCGGCSSAPPLATHWLGWLVIALALGRRVTRS